MITQDNKTKKKNESYMDTLLGGNFTLPPDCKIWINNYGQYIDGGSFMIITETTKYPFLDWSVNFSGHLFICEINKENFTDFKIEQGNYRTIKDFIFEFEHDFLKRFYNISLIVDSKNTPGSTVFNDDKLNDFINTLNVYYKEGLISEEKYEKKLKLLSKYNNYEFYMVAKPFIETFRLKNYKKIKTTKKVVSLYGGEVGVKAKYSGIKANEVFLRYANDIFNKNYVNYSKPFLTERELKQMERVLNINNTLIVENCIRNNFENIEDCLMNLKIVSLNKKSWLNEIRKYVEEKYNEEVYLNFENELFKHIKIDVGYVKNFYKNFAEEINEKIKTYSNSNYELGKKLLINSVSSYKTHEDFKEIMYNISHKYFLENDKDFEQIKKLCPEFYVMEDSISVKEEGYHQEIFSIAKTNLEKLFNRKITPLKKSLKDFYEQEGVELMFIDKKDRILFLLNSTKKENLTKDIFDEMIKGCQKLLLENKLENENNKRENRTKIKEILLNLKLRNLDKENNVQKEVKAKKKI